MAATSGTGVDLGSWTIGEDLTRTYLEAVGNPGAASLELGLAPPLALSAWALGAMLDTLSLPSGAIHSRQELQTHRAVRFGETVHATAHPGKPAQRTGLTMLAIGYSLEDEDGRPVQTGRSSVLTGVAPTAPRDNASPSRPGERDRERNGGGTDNPDANAGQDVLPAARMTISQIRLSAYALASGDKNPLHLDAGFAAGTQFRGIIAHGMLTLATISEMMEARFGKAWPESGEMNVRFKGAAYVGDRIESHGRVTRKPEGDVRRKVSCAVGVRDIHSGQDLITGTASVMPD